MLPKRNTGVEEIPWEEEDLVVKQVDQHRQRHLTIQCNPGVEAAVGIDRRGEPFDVGEDGNCDNHTYIYRYLLPPPFLKNE